MSADDQLQGKDWLEISLDALSKYVKSNQYKQLRHADAALARQVKAAHYQLWQAFRKVPNDGVIGMSACAYYLDWLEFGLELLPDGDFDVYDGKKKYEVRVITGEDGYCFTLNGRPHVCRVEDPHTEAAAYIAIVIQMYDGESEPEPEEVCALYNMFRADEPPFDRFDIQRAILDYLFPES